MLRRAPVAVLLVAFVLAFHAGAARAATSLVPRPTEPGADGYAVPEAEPYSSARVVVHYVATGKDAPPLNDDDHNGVADYIEQIGAAADTALSFYSAHGFRAPLPDAAGPDPRPDIYVKRRDSAVLGLAIPPALASGGPFVEISPRLDSNPDEALASLPLTVAHEVFHLVQFAYARDGSLPGWAAEGTANAMAQRIFPNIAELVSRAETDAWLGQPWRSLTDVGDACQRCYGESAWWLYVDGLGRRVLPAYFAALGSSANARAGAGVDALDRILRRLGHGSLSSVFNTFSVDLYRSSRPPATAYAIQADGRMRASGTIPLAPLAAHYVRVNVPAGADGLDVAVPAIRGEAARVSLVLGGRKGRLVRAKQFKSGGGLVVAAHFRSAAERRDVGLVITGGADGPSAYRLAFVAVAKQSILPGWIAWSKGR